MRRLAALAVCFVLGTVSVHAQEHHGAAKATGAGPRGAAPVVKPAAPKVEPPKPSVVEPAKPQAAKPAAAKPTRTLEETAEAIAAALAARAGAPRPPRVMGGAASATAPRAAVVPTYRGPRYQLRWPDLQWDVQWPAKSDRMALEWPDSHRNPASH